jgi:hypothetical protein
MKYALARLAQICAAFGSSLSAASKHSFATLIASARSTEAPTPAFAPAPEKLGRGSRSCSHVSYINHI